MVKDTHVSVSKMAFSRKKYQGLLANAYPAPSPWREPCVHAECTLHQLSPYIGKLKSSIARDLVVEYSSPNDLVVDPFCGAGTIPLEAALQGRRVFAADISPYARVLTQAKLKPPSSLDNAIAEARSVIARSVRIVDPDLRTVPKWVRDFYHPSTLKEVLKIASLCRLERHDFLFACLLGILHHQRPGFLSYPSSHLVPYLRDHKYPRHKYPKMYAYRPVEPRLIAKIERAYKRFPGFLNGNGCNVEQTPIDAFRFRKNIDCLITSPPYMNALDYGRDNRLRLWFIEPDGEEYVDNEMTKQKQAFVLAMNTLAIKIEDHLKIGGYAVFVIGERVTRSYAGHPSEVIFQCLYNYASSMKLLRVIVDHVPDVRRSRRNCTAIKTEHVLIFQKSKI
jgi:hypothetical protein